MYRSCWVEMDHGGVHYLETPGAVDTPVLLLHGGGSDSAELSWGPLLSAPGVPFRGIAPDLPGYGRSASWKEPHRLDLYVRFLEDLLGRTDIGNLALVGSSLGGMVALRFALCHPDKVDRLVLVASAGLGRERRLLALGHWLACRPGLYKRLRRTLIANEYCIRRTLRELFYDPRKIDGELLSQVRQAALLCDEGEGWRSLLEHEAGFRGFPDHSSQLPEITCPTLLVHGREDRYVPVEASIRAADLIPSSELVIVERCGHWPAREAPEQFRTLLFRFLVGSATNPEVPRRESHGNPI